jgi:hypothetical protein
MFVLPYIANELHQHSPTYAWIAVAELGQDFPRDNTPAIGAENFVVKHEGQELFAQDRIIAASEASGNGT